MIVAGENLKVPMREIELRYTRSSGPGGQNVNKVNSKAVLRWPVATSPSLPEDVRRRFLARFERRITTGGELVIASDRFRDRTRNAKDCLERLREMLASVAVAPRARRPSRPKRAAVERRLQEKRARSKRKNERRAPAAD